MYFLLRDGGDNSVVMLAERSIPLQQGSNFRDLGGYEADYSLLGQLRIGTIVDLPSTDERQIAPDMLDDRTGALFVSNDYSLKSLMTPMASRGGEYVYAGMGKALAPQYRAMFRRLLADEGATLYHCSAGQDRTGVATALIYSALGVPRETILKDYHLSTELRRPQFEMPPLDPAEWPGNPIVPYYVAAQSRPGGAKAEPLFTPSGKAHLAQFFEVIDREYGSVAGYLTTELGLSERDIGRLKSLYLD